MDPNKQGDIARLMLTALHAQTVAAHALSSNEAGQKQ